MSELNIYPLFELVKSLSGSEKRYFKIFAAHHTIGDSNIYIHLFDAVCRMKEWDEESIFRKNQKIRREQIHNLKKYLYEMILKSLESYHAGSSVDAVLRQQINFILVLYRKALYKQCRAAIKKAKALAYRYEKLNALSEILYTERALMTHFFGQSESADDATAQIEKISIERKEVLKKIQLTDKCDYYNKRIYGWYLKYGTVRDPSTFEEIALLTQKILEEIKEEALPYYAKIFICNGLELYYMFINDTERRLEYSKKHIEVLESKPDIIPDNIRSYIAGLNNLMSGLLFAKRYDEFNIYLYKFRNIEKNFSRIRLTELQQVNIFQLSYNLELKVLMEKGKFMGAMKLIPYIQKKLSEYGDKMSHIARLLFYFNISVLYMSLGQYSRSLEWLNKILNRKVIDTRQDIYCFARIFNLIVHYELGNNDLLDHQVRSTYRYLSKREGLHKFESAILRFIRKRLSKVSDREDLSIAFSELKSELEQIIKDPLENIAWEYFDVISWLESKIERKSFSEVVERKHNRRN